MGIYFNPNNGSFSKDKRSEVYVDKTGLLEFLNARVSSEENCICVRHAHRFGNDGTYIAREYD